MSARRFYWNAGYVFVFNGIAVGCGLVKNIILARFISETNLGLYSLLFAIVGFVYPLSLVGQQTALVRFLSAKDAKAYDLRQELSRILLVSAVLTVIGSVVAAKIYALTLLPFLFLIVVTLAYSVTDLIPAVLRAQGIYTLSIFIFRGINFFLLAAVVVLALTGTLSLASVLWVFVAAFALFAAATTVLSSRYFGRGPERLPLSTWKDGMLFWGTDLSLLVIISIDRFLIPKLLSLEALGLYFAISAIMRVFELALQSTEFVLLPYARRLQKGHMLRLVAGVLIAGLLITAGYLIAGPRLVSLLYGGKYDHGTYLIPYFCIVGFMRFIYVIPYSIISGSLHGRRLRQLFGVNLGTMVLSVVLMLFFISWWGLAGAALATAVVWSIRAIMGFAIMYLERRFPSESHAQISALEKELM